MLPVHLPNVGLRLTALHGQIHQHQSHRKQQRPDQSLHGIKIHTGFFHNQGYPIDRGPDSVACRQWGCNGTAQGYRTAFSHGPVPGGAGSADEQQQYAEKQQSDPLGLLKGRTHLLSIHHGLLHGEKRQRL